MRNARAFAQARDYPRSLFRTRAESQNSMPTMLGEQEEAIRSVFINPIDWGRTQMVLLALWMERGGR
jgi:hypothetical protein